MKGTLYFELSLAARVPNFDVSILFDSVILEVGTAFTMQRKDLRIKAFNGILYPRFAAGCGMIWATARIIYGALTASPAKWELFWVTPGLHHSSKPLCRLCGEVVSVPEKGRITCTFSLFD